MTMQGDLRTSPAGVPPHRRTAGPDAAIAERLRVGTSDLHARIEANPRFSRLMAPDLGRAEYTALLARLLGFHAGIEAALRLAAADLPAALALDRRLIRSALLRRDLVALGLSGQDIAAVPVAFAPSLATAEAAWGTLYVIEGSSLGGQLIARHLAQVLGLGPDSGAAGQTPYGAQTGAMWRGFKAMLADAHATGRLDPESTVAWARHTFAAMDGWMRDDGSPERPSPAPG